MAAMSKNIVSSITTSLFCFFFIQKSIQNGLGIQNNTSSGQERAPITVNQVTKRNKTSRRVVLMQSFNDKQKVHIQYTLFIHRHRGDGAMASLGVAESSVLCATGLKTLSGPLLKRAGSQ